MEERQRWQLQQRALCQGLMGRALRVRAAGAAGAGSAPTAPTGAAAGSTNKGEKQGNCRGRGTGPDEEIMLSEIDLLD